MESRFNELLDDGDYQAVEALLTEEVRGLRLIDIPSQTLELMIAKMISAGIGLYYTPSVRDDCVHIRTSPSEDSESEDDYCDNFQQQLRVAIEVSQCGQPLYISIDNQVTRAFLTLARIPYIPVYQIQPTDEIPPLWDILELFTSGLRDQQAQVFASLLMKNYRGYIQAILDQGYVPRIPEELDPNKLTSINSLTLITIMTSISESIESERYQIFLKLISLPRIDNGLLDREEGDHDFYLHPCLVNYWLQLRNEEILPENLNSDIIDFIDYKPINITLGANWPALVDADVNLIECTREEYTELWTSSPTINENFVHFLHLRGLSIPQQIDEIKHEYSYPQPFSTSIICLEDHPNVQELIGSYLLKDGYIDSHLGAIIIKLLTKKIITLKPYAGHPIADVLIPFELST